MVVIRPSLSALIKSYNILKEELGSELTPISAVNVLVCELPPPFSPFNIKPVRLITSSLVSDTETPATYKTNSLMSEVC